MRGILRSRSKLAASAAIAALLVTVTVGVPPASAQPSIGIMGAGDNDFTGDGYADMTALYDYGNGEAGLFVVPGTPEIRDQVTRPRMVWWEGPGNFYSNDMKITSGGDFNGDGYDDVLAVYRYAEGFGIYVYPGSPTLDSSTAAAPYEITFMFGNFSLANTKITAGDFDGDGLADLQLLYYYGVGETAMRLVPGTTSRAWRSGRWYEVWRSARYPGSFELPRAQIASADFTRDGKDDLLALYNYGNNEFALFVMPGTTGAPGTSNGYWCWHSSGSHDFTNATLDTGDFTGDGYKDLVIHKNNTVFVTPGTDQAGDFATAPYVYFNQPALVGAKSIVGDYDNNGAADLISLLDHGNGSSSVWVLKGNVPNINNREMLRVFWTGSGNFWPSVVKVA